MNRPPPVLYKVPLTQGQFTYVCEEALKKMGDRPCYATYDKHRNKFYARIRPNGRCRAIGLHSFLKGAPGLIVDHLNGNPLHNWMDNLEAGSHSDNRRSSLTCRASSGYRWVKPVKGGWAGFVTLQSPVFENKTEAARVADNLALSIGFGISALNFPKEHNPEFFLGTENPEDVSRSIDVLVVDRRGVTKNSKHSRYLGVSRNGNGWIARLRGRRGRADERPYLGWFKELVEAARAYDRAAFARDGSAARLNFPDEYLPKAA